MIRNQCGAGPWRQGADTCIFNPALACTDNKGHRYGPEYVSRVTNPQDTALRVETVLKTEYSGLVDLGWVTAYEHKCTPFYEPEDAQYTDSFKDKYLRPMRRGQREHPPGACETKVKAKNMLGISALQVNLISKRVGQEFADLHTSRFDVRKCIEELRHAFSAAVALVPDTGTWIINTDMHAGNILMNETHGKFMLHDWGRSILIENAQLDSQIVAGIKSFRDEVYPERDWPSVPVGFQLPQQMSDAVMDIYATHTVTPEEKATLRVWTVFVLFKTITNYSNMLPNTIPPGMTIDDYEDNMLRFLTINATSQAQLAFAVDAIITALLEPGKTVTPISYVIDPNL